MDKNTYRHGLICAISCSVLWGVVPIYWNLLKPIDSSVIIFYRIFLLVVTCFLACLFIQKNIKSIFNPFFSDKRKMCIFIVAGIIITANWSIYIWAVNAGFVIQSSLGYFLEPLAVCLLGIVIYKEKANKFKKIAIGFACIGILIMIIGYKELPIIAIGLALTAAIYAAIKKSISLNPLQSLLFETLFIAPIALLVIVYLESSGQGALVYGGGKYVLLLFAGVVTAVPLALFSSAANKIPLVTLGLTEYICPSISLLLGIFLFKEPFDIVQFSAFVVIWIGVAFFTYGEILDSRKNNEN